MLLAQGWINGAVSLSKSASTGTSLWTMPQTRVPVADFIGKKLPGVCAMTGTIARNTFAIAARSKNGPIVGAIPLTGAAVTGMRQMQQVTLGSFFISITAMALAIAAQNMIIGWIAFSLLIGAIGCLVLTYKRGIRATVADDGKEVVLDHVHPNFVNAITSPPSKCGGCTSKGDCSISEMHACENEPVSAQ